MATRTALLRLQVDSDHLPPRLVAVVRVLSRKAFRNPFERYHPERHYMRGPGPRWHAKHGPAEPTGRNG